MRKTSQCPKCGSSSIVGPTDTRNMEGRIKVRLPLKGIFFPRSVPLSVYFCLECGYVESYIEKDDLMKTRKIIEEKGLEKN